MQVDKSGPGILSVSIDNKDDLYDAFMPFVKNGGIFIKTQKSFKMGDEVFMLLNLMGEGEKLPIAGKIVWVTPRNAQSNRACGVGIQFSDQDKGQLRGIIETHLAGRLESGDQTNTM